ncbi:MAG: hypothetical protein U5K56_13920 [Halioglobus sp.]|nr:hypothetical protein [Halioglobus sp.]
MAETSDQRRIRAILEEREPDPDHSLRGQALERATEEKLPRTLTPHEWEQWYREHGIPPSHRAPTPSRVRTGYLARLLQRLLSR